MANQRDPRNQLKIAIFLKAENTISLNKRMAGMETNWDLTWNFFCLFVFCALRKLTRGNNWLYTNKITLLKICKQSSIFILQVSAKSVEEKCNRNNVKSCKQIMNWLVYKLGRYLFCYCFHRRYRSTTLHVAGCIS